jgi:tetratricopeptide (TPR) repeat protein
VTSKEIAPLSRTAQDLRQDPKYIQVFDQYGRELFVTKEQWRTGSLPGALKKNWENPSQLYGLVVMALRYRFFPDVVEAAEHLYHTDAIQSRGTTIYGIVLMKLGDLDRAEKVFQSYLSSHPEDGTVLTNLAKVYSERGEPQRSEATLWHALEVDPNMENALAWYRAIHRERDGEAADLHELQRVAALPGSWRAQMWQARAALQSHDLVGALELYRVGLNNAGRPAPTDLLVQMSGDLGNHGHLSEALALTEVAFVPKEHGLLVGNNLIKAHLDMGQIEAAAKILDQLYSLERPDWKEHGHCKGQGRRQAVHFQRPTCLNDALYRRSCLAKTPVPGR